MQSRGGEGGRLLNIEQPQHADDVTGCRRGRGYRTVAKTYTKRLNSSRAPQIFSGVLVLPLGPEGRASDGLNMVS